MGNRRTVAVLCASVLMSGMAVVAATPAAAISDPGEVYGWGGNSLGRVGDGTTTDRPVPVAVCAPGGTAPCGSVLDDAVQVADALGNHSIALMADGSVYAWGGNSDGQLGDGTTTNSSVPVQVCAVGQSAPCATFLDDVVAISAGVRHSLALRSDGSVVAWGDNFDGQLGDGTTAASSVPVQVCAVGQSAPCATFLDDAVAISAGVRHSLAVVGGGEVRSWGDNVFGQLGDNTSTNRSVPVAVCGDSSCGAPLTGITAIDAGALHSLALTSTGVALAWGRNSSGQLGDGTTNDRDTPVQVCAEDGCPSSLSPITQISGAGFSSHALMADGTVRGWGSNGDGQLGRGNNIGSSLPVRVCAVGQSAPCANLLMGVTEVNAGGSHVLARIDDTLVSWGDNTAGGQLGDGTTTDRPAPVQVCASAQTAPCTSFLDLVGTMSGGQAHSHAIRVTTPPPADEADLAVGLSAAAVLLQPRIDYTVGVTNNGPDALVSATVVTAVPSTTTSVTNLGPCSYNGTLKQVSCPVGALASSAGTNFTFRANISALTVGLPLTAATQRTTSSPNDPNPANDADTANCVVITGLIILC
ncbi:MAG: hypothetical protein WBA97_10380 [Actinophytocola sp.]|uniref:RCC1 domain-containing protein n=1 Tax=Actinophytocola sp. TaxID=1872138 RepID=UPI003C771DBA